MPKPTGIRDALSRPFALHTNSHKPVKDGSIYHQNHNSSPSDRGDQQLSLGRMDIFNAKDKRKSIHMPGRTSSPGKSSPKSSPKMGPAKPAKLVVDMESPPLVFHGTTVHSTGALLSGQLLLTVTDAEITLQDFTMVLEARVTTKKPVAKDCPDCVTKVNQLFSWTFLSEPTLFKKGIHTFPFSHLLPGHLPATSESDLGLVDYSLSAKGTTALHESITVQRSLTVQRALMPGLDKNSIRIFPPTNLTATVVTPSVIYPIGTFPVQMRLSGLVDTSLKDIQRRWRIRKMSWRIEEQNRIISAACNRHAQRIGGHGKGILHEDTRTIGAEDLKSGWKTDFECAGGQIEMEFTAGIRANSHPVCDLESPTGLSSSHHLLLELIVAEEQTSIKHGKYATPTGAARVLRMQFKLTLTQRAGLGISWDEEMPPVYEDVPNSPPGYTKMDDFDGDLATLPQIEDHEQMRLE